LNVQNTVTFLLSVNVDRRLREHVAHLFPRLPSFNHHLPFLSHDIDYLLPSLTDKKSTLRPLQVLSELTTHVPEFPAPTFAPIFDSALSYSSAIVRHARLSQRQTILTAHEGNFSFGAAQEVIPPSFIRPRVSACFTKHVAVRKLNQHSFSEVVFVVLRSHVLKYMAHRKP
jgi:hypothetical protein